MTAQYNSINIDYETAAVMVAEYNAAAAAEMYYDEQVKDILEKYGLAEVAAAGIYTSKHLDRKALTSLGDWSSPTENFYYRRIYSLVSTKIIPGLWDLSTLLLHYPHKALYWGSYLAKTCTEVKCLCQQFESIVTNSTLSFSDINFLELNPQIAAIIQLSKIGDVDWKSVLNGMTYVAQSFNKENLSNDLDSFYAMGTQLATSGFENLASDLMGNSDFNGNFLQKAASVCEIAQNAYDIYSEAEGDLANLLKNYWGENPTAADIFDFSNYDMASWITDYLATDSTSCYTQRYYIACVDKGTQLVCNYVPPTGRDEVTSGDHWTRFDTRDPSFSPNANQLESVLSNSETYAGWSRSLVASLNAQGTGNKYQMSQYLMNYTITSGGRQTKKAYAYVINVVKSWNFEEIAYEETFDSYSMDLPTFLNKMNGLLEEYNENEEGKHYQLLKDEKHYYEAVTEAKVKGCESALITLTCTDDVNLAAGSTQYKCSSCGKSLNSHSKECAMRTTLSSGDESLDLSELYSKQAQLESDIATAQSQLEDQLKEKSFLEEQIANYSNKGDATYQQLVNDLQTINGNISTLKSRISSLQRDLERVNAAIEEGSNDTTETDDYYRIPAIMEDARTAFRLTWQGEGWWSGYTYYRTATAPSVNGTITFQATLSIARKPSYFLGIKIHRAILKISWSLSVTYTTTQVMDNLVFDSDTPDDEKNRRINDKLSELARDYPNCTPSVEYIRVEDDDVEEDTEDVQHLLWSSDRLAIARQVEARLMNIYADIVSMKKMMHYQLGILDVVGGALPYVNDEQGKKQTLAERCRRRWLKNAADRHHSLGYNGKYDIEEEDNE